ncbi:hypothetical protein AB0J82_35185 [Asanoa sp. NPDC049518]|uniref:hypothetical protein n=1 Tax=unclassified Asanoa TaxID=2685164 RepID=UPI00342A4E5E
MDLRTLVEGLGGIRNAGSEIRATVAAARDSNGEVDVALVDVERIERGRADMRTAIKWVQGAYGEPG